MVSQVFDRVASSFRVRDVMVPVLTLRTDATVGEVIALLESNEEHGQVFLQGDDGFVGCCYRDDEQLMNSPPSDPALEHSRTDKRDVGHCVDADMTIHEFLRTMYQEEFYWVVDDGTFLGWASTLEVEAPAIRICLFSLLSDLDQCVKGLLATYYHVEMTRLVLVEQLQDEAEVQQRLVNWFNSGVPQYRLNQILAYVRKGQSILDCLNFEDKHHALKILKPRLSDNFALRFGGTRYFARTKRLRDGLAHGAPIYEMVDGWYSEENLSEYVAKTVALTVGLDRYVEDLRSAMRQWVECGEPYTSTAMDAAVEAVQFIGG